jgi:putative peptidoglycan lipid II flippase
LSGFVLIKVFASGYFSRQDTKTPVKIGIVAVVSNIVLSVLLVMPLAHAGLALATSLASFINAGLLFYFLQKRNVYQIQKGWGLFLCRVIMACMLMSVALLYLVPPVEIWLQWDVFNRARYLAQWIVLGMVIYSGVLWMSGLRLRHMTMDS